MHVKPPSIIISCPLIYSFSTVSLWAHFAISIGWPNFLTGTSLISFTNCSALLFLNVNLVSIYPGEIVLVNILNPLVSVTIDLVNECKAALLLE